MRNKTSIYSDCNSQLTKLFYKAGHPAKVLCVALDYAKNQHCALVCDGQGEVIKDVFTVDNNLPGSKLLVEAVRACAKHRRIQTEHVFFGGEDCPSFADNFLRQLRKNGFLVVRVNAAEAKRQRDNQQASSDKLDLLGIARCLLKRNCTTVEDWPQAYANLRIATRNRDKLVRLHTVASNRIHSYVDRLLPGFLDEDKCGLTPFGKASLELMSEGLDAGQINHRSKAALSRWLSRRGVKDASHAAGKLKALAKSAPTPEPKQSQLLKRTLGQCIELYRQLDGTISAMDQEMAYWLARTPGVFLTSVAGIGVTLAASWMAELGPVKQWRSTRQLCSYGGVVPRTKQTGGPEKAPSTGRVSQIANKRFKNVLLQSVLKVLEHGPADFLSCVAKLQQQGSHVTFAIAKRLIRLNKRLANSSMVYRPRALLNSQAPREELRAYYLDLWPKLVAKWRQKADIKDVFDEKNPLGEWRKMVQQIYTLELCLPRQAKPGVSTP